MKTSADDYDDYHQKAISELRENGRKVGCEDEGLPMALAHNAGAKSGVGRFELRRVDC